jgi:hypothetical protein
MPQNIMPLEGDEYNECTFMEESRAMNGYGYESRLHFHFNLLDVLNLNLYSESKALGFLRYGGPVSVLISFYFHIKYHPEEPSIPAPD